VIEVTAVSLGNGSYKAEAPVPVADSYDLTVELEDSGGSRAEIVDSPLENKILVSSGLVQAAYTNIVTSYDPLTAGVTYVFTIVARDIFENIVLNSDDKINFEIRGPESAVLS
jgi:hypothetical protein